MKKKDVDEIWKGREEQKKRIKNLIEEGMAYTICSTIFNLNGYQKVDSYNFDTGWAKCGGKSFMIASSDIISLKTIWAKLDLTRHLKEGVENKEEEKEFRNWLKEKSYGD